MFAFMILLFPLAVLFLSGLLVFFVLVEYILPHRKLEDMHHCRGGACCLFKIPFVLIIDLVLVAIILGFGCVIAAICMIPCFIITLIGLCKIFYNWRTGAQKTSQK